MDSSLKDLLKSVENGFEGLNLDSKYKISALNFLEKWLSDDAFIDYKPQIEYFIKNKEWEYILDCFYQIIPFGTGGRRGEVGIGPNRINTWTIQASAQGHSQYLMKQYGNLLSSRGIVLAFGVREYFADKHYNSMVPNPVDNLKGIDLAYSAASVYTANGIKVYIFDSPRTTPELSFAIRYFRALAGDMFDASHNPPEHNGKKVYDEFGGQLIPPADESLVDEVTKNVQKIKTISLDDAKKQSLFEVITSEVDEKYIAEISNLSLSNENGINIAFTPLHGVGSTSILKVLQHKNFDVQPDPRTSNQSGKFENITFNIPNPEVVESFDTTLEFVSKNDAEIILNSDPDADRIGIMVKHNNSWRFLNGNEIGIILARYVISKRKHEVGENGVMIKTAVTSDLTTKICEANNVKMIGDLLVGFKYIAEIMNSMDRDGTINNFLFGLEESHGYIAGNYVRDKDGAIAGLWLAGLASELKSANKTLVDYLNETYIKYGYFRNYLTEIRLLGADGMSKINKIQDTMRSTKPIQFGDFQVEKIEDCWDRKPIVSESDKMSKNVLVFHIKPVINTTSIKITLRPSGTEPKIKMYFEIGTLPTQTVEEFHAIKEYAENLRITLERLFMKHCYKILDVDFPDRGFLLFWQLPLKAKLHYFEIETQIVELKNVPDREERIQKLEALLEFLGSDPIEKIDKAFAEEYKASIKEYLNL